MGFLAERTGAEKVGAMLALMVLGIAVKAVWAGGLGAYFSPHKRAENAIVKAMETRPGDLAVLTAMKRDFPLEYAELLDSMADTALSAQSPNAILAAGGRNLGAFMAKHRNDFAAAPIASLDAVLANERAILDELGKGEAVVCNDYLSNSIQQSDALTPALSRLLGEGAARKVEAMAAGRRDQQLRFALTPADMTALAGTMEKAGASKAQVAVFIRSGDPSALDYREQCEGAVMLVKAIAAQPEERRALLIGAMFAPS